MSTATLPHTPATFTLFRVFADGHEEIVPGTTTDHTEGIRHGHRLMREHSGAAFSLYRGDKRVAKFAHHTLALRLRIEAVAMMAR